MIIQQVDQATVPIRETRVRTASAASVPHLLQARPAAVRGSIAVERKSRSTVRVTIINLCACVRRTLLVGRFSELERGPYLFGAVTTRYVHFLVIKHNSTVVRSLLLQ